MWHGCERKRFSGTGHGHIIKPAGCVRVFITPMFLFSGTFFPVANLPPWAQYMAMALPLTHLTLLARSLCYSRFEWEMLASLACLIVFGAVFFPLALRKMRQRLVK